MKTRIENQRTRTKLWTKKIKLTNTFPILKFTSPVTW